MLWLVSVLCAAAVAAAPRDDGGADRIIFDTPEAILANGYPVELHHPVTEDGYILGVHRIPHGRDQAPAADRPVVYLMHGLYSVDFQFVSMDPEFSMGYNMADAGFDVWMGNARGNRYSRNHTTLDPDGEADHMRFFDFSWEEVGMYDIPAAIDYILNYTGKDKLHYIGHSQGGTVFLVMGAMRPEYNAKLETVHLLAGVGYQEYFPNTILRAVATFSDIIYNIALSQGLIEMYPARILEVIIGIIVGGGSTTRDDLCFGDPKHSALCQLIGTKYFMPPYIMRDDINATNIGDVMDMFAGLGGGSLKQVAHYGQNIRDKIFRRFHYDSEQNLELYGTRLPPAYDLSLITSRVIMHYTVNDVLLDERDVYAMAADLPNAQVRRVAREDFGHEEFVTAEDARELVTDYIIDYIARAHNRELDEEDGDAAVTDAPIPTTTPDSATDLTFNVFLKLYLLLCTIYYVI
ncbi:lipase 3-like [Pectinophora gossypiella]|uniref:Partial AB-hydrolase lipase domain-containing protein n=1 Tax=Pectinophora gossypiella TaxID=13191 RepID=A0A1E1WD27_PECGO|nr:lipase 3-like [Pectinophora gossypiella]